MTMNPKVRVTKRGEVKKSCPPGYKLHRGACVKMPPAEVKRRRESARRAAQKRAPRRPARPPGTS